MAENLEQENKKGYEIQGDGKQLNYADYLTYKKDFNESRTVSYSSSDLYQKRLRERDDAIADTLFYGAAGLGIGSLLYHQASRNENISYLISELPSANLAKLKLTKQYTENKAAGLILNAIDPRSNGTQPLSQSLHSMLMGVEELSPMQIMKTLQMSSFSQLFVEILDQKHNEMRLIRESSIRAYGDYYSNLIKKESNISLTNQNIKDGFIIENNRLYQAVHGKDGIKKGRVLLNHAKIVTSGIKTGPDSVSMNRIAEKFANRQGSKLTRTMVETEPFMIVGSSTKNKLMQDWVKSYGAFAAELGAKSLDNPLGFLEEYLNLAGVGDHKIFKSKAFQTAKKFTNFQLGAGGVYHLGTKEMLKRTGKNLAVKGLAATAALGVANGVLDAITPDSSVWSNGIVAGVSDTIMRGHIKFAELWSDNFQNLKKAQENAAPGSTSLVTLMGLPLAGVMAGANLAYFSRMKDTATKGIDEASVRSVSLKSVDGMLGKVLDKLGKNAPTSKLGRYSKIGALAGATLALPFLPGALIGKSSDELRAEYSGEKKVAVRQNRAWLSGGNSYEGGKIMYHRDHLLRTLASDAKVKTLYGDRETQRRLNPILNPIGYLRNPYQFEEMHTHDMPMPVWGMDVSYGSFLGQAYKGTVGQIIKPTVVNTNLLKEQERFKKESDLLQGKLGILEKIVETAEKKRGVNKNGEYVGFSPSTEDGYSPETLVTRGDPVDPSYDSDSYVVPTNEKKEVKSLIDDGLMLKPNSPTNEPYTRGFQASWSTAEEFIGLKGFTGGLLLNQAGISPVDQLRPELEISGSSTNFSKLIMDAQLGDALGSGEYLRRLFPQSASSRRETVNPMRNLVTPDWLPKNETKYYENFEKGNYYSHIENGEYLLPGSKGFDTLNPHLKGIDPNDFPLVYQYSILQNVARNSSEHIAIKEHLIRNLDTLSDAEKDVFFEAYGQDEARDRLKEFSEYATEDEKGRMGIFNLHNALWESVAHKENPLEPLLPFRPMAKFVHKRTAEEDYIKTQIMGPDTGIWTNPYSHFIKPAINRSVSLGDPSFQPEEYKEKNRIDQYFDKLALIKADKNGEVYDKERNITALSYLGVTNAEEMRRFKMALDTEQRAYVDSFSREKNAEKRERILKMLPNDIGRVYQSIWRNIDEYDRAVAMGLDPKKAIEAQYLKDTTAIAKAAKVEFSFKERYDHISDYLRSTKEGAKGLSELDRAKQLRMKAAIKDAKTYVSNQTGGLPSDKWIGWDPRLTMDDIKLKTLMVGREDIHRFGYWHQDVERIERLIGLNDTGPIVDELDNIRSENRANTVREQRLKRTLRASGFEPTRIVSSSANKNQLRINDTQDYLDEVYGQQQV